MAKEVTVIGGLTVKYKGVYEFEGFYRMMRDWFDRRKYDFTEKVYKSKRDGPGTYEAEFALEAEKKITEYAKYDIELLLKFINVQEREVKTENGIKKVTDGRVELRIIKATTTFDYQNKFKGSLFFGLLEYSKLQDFVIDVLLKNYYEFKYYGPLEGEILDFHKKMKEHLNMESA
ncbi:MAG: hypothetical protein ACMXX7_00490 [Candidatus Woesearchaeota archaeon]